MNVVTRAGGRTANQRRYIGFSRGRIRQEATARIARSEFIAWAKTLAEEIETSSGGATLFDRFASPIPTPANPTPLSILFETDDIEKEFSQKGGDKPIDIEEACIDLVDTDSDANKAGNVTIDGNSYGFLLGWDGDRKKYLMKSQDLENYRLRSDERRTLVKWLNQRQPFRVVPTSPGTIYSSGDFFQIDLRLSAGSGASEAILNLMNPLAALNDLKSEKGTLTKPSQSWPKESVFGVIDREVVTGRRDGLFGERFDTVVCDDLNDETSDFVCLDAARLVLIHAKAGSGSQVSASALHDVCSQAVKNLGYLKADNQELPGDGGKWNRLWKLKGGEVPRIRCGAKTGAEIRAEIRKLKKLPSTRRQVWLVLGALLSKSAFSRKLANPPPELTQAYHLLTGLHSTCQSLGVELRVYCSE